MTGSPTITIIGLTGSIGMGKSTVAAMFRDLDIPVFDADAEVHRLYAQGGAAVAGIARQFAGAVRDDAVDRTALAAMVTGDKAALSALEEIVHPLVKVAEERFVDAARSEGAHFAVLEIPLLYEVGAEDRVDVVAVVSAPASVQRERVLARPGMTADKFAALLARQTSDEEKRAKADFVIDTGGSLEETRHAVGAMMAALEARQCKGKADDARNRA